MKFLKWLGRILTKFSFIAYLFSLRSEVKSNVMAVGGRIFKSKGELKKQADELGNTFTALENQTKARNEFIKNHPRVSTAAEFTDDSTRSAYELRKEQLNVLNYVKQSQDSVASDATLMSSAIARCQQWIGQMDCKVDVAKTKNPPKELLKKLAEADLGLDGKAWLRELKKGGTVTLSLTYSAAQYLSALFNSYGIKSFYRLNKLWAVEQNCVPDREALNETYKKIALRQRLTICILWMAIGIINVVFGASFDLLLTMSIVAIVIFLALWGVSLLIKLVLANFAALLMKPILRKVKADYVTAVSALVYEEIQDVYEPTSEKFAQSVLNSVNYATDSDEVLKKWALGFLPAKIYNGKIDFICQQMNTGASYNEACWRADQVEDREKWKAERRALEAKRDEEAKKYRASMLAEQKRRADNAAMAASYARQAADEARSAKVAMQDAAAAERERANEIRKLREELELY